MILTYFSIDFAKNIIIYEPKPEFRPFLFNTWVFLSKKEWKQLDKSLFIKKDRCLQLQHQHFQVVGYMVSKGSQVPP